MNKTQTLSFHRRNLPHWYVANKTYFVTFCLKGAIPLTTLNELRIELNVFIQTHPSEKELDDFHRQRFVKVEKFLDTAWQSPGFLTKQGIPELVLSGFEWLETNHGWVIPAVVVMPSHVHCLMRNTEGKSALLGKHIGIMKGYVARQANQILNRSGAFWLSEAFDRWCRSPEKYEAAIRYIKNNPVKAGLVRCPADWPWVKIT